jgi:hypothetical protein
MGVQLMTKQELDKLPRAKRRRMVYTTQVADGLATTASGSKYLVDANGTFRRWTPKEKENGK